MKQIIRHFSFTSFLLLSIASCFVYSAKSQTLPDIILSDNPPQAIKLEVKRVDIGASHKTVIRRLGKPLSSKKGGTNPCGGTKLTLRYSGLTVTLDSVDTDGQNFIVVSLEVASPKWEVASGIRTGASLQDVRSKFGQSSELRKKKGMYYVSYFVTDGYANFYFRNKKLVKVEWDLNLC
jgi:hypothetical protein